MTKLLSYRSAALFLAPQIIVAFLLLPLSLIRRLLHSAKKGSSWTRTMLFRAIAVIGASTLLEHSGASNPPATSTPNTTPAGNYTVPVTAASSGTAMSLNLQVTVQ